ncbi:MAG: NAD(P)-binding domain-containing protein [Hoeflea sp.]
MRYGFIGLGNLGGHLAVSMLKAGFEVTVNDLDPSLGKRHVDMGGTWAAIKAS